MVSPSPCSPSRSSVAASFLFDQKKMFGCEHSEQGEEKKDPRIRRDEAGSCGVPSCPKRIPRCHDRAQPIRIISATADRTAAAATYAAAAAAAAAEKRNSEAAAVGVGIDVVLRYSTVELYL